MGGEIESKPKEPPQDEATAGPIQLIHKAFSSLYRLPFCISMI